jgi:hypothetical protein
MYLRLTQAIHPALFRHDLNPIALVSKFNGPFDTATEGRMNPFWTTQLTDDQIVGLSSGCLINHASTNTNQLIDQPILAAIDSSGCRFSCHRILFRAARSVWTRDAAIILTVARPCRDEIRHRKGR